MLKFKEKYKPKNDFMFQNISHDLKSIKIIPSKNLRLYQYNYDDSRNNVCDMTQI